MNWISILFLFVLLGVCLYTDLKRSVIHNEVTIPVLIAGLFASLFYSYHTAGVNGIIAVILNLLIAFTICETFLIPNKIWAHGDAKLFLACMVWFPPFIGMISILALYFVFHFAYNVLYLLMKKRNIMLPTQYPGSILLALVTIINIFAFQFMSA